MPAKSIKQQRFMGMVRAAQKGEGAASPEVAKVAASMKKKDAKDFASTKHKGLPMKKEEVSQLDEMPYQVYGSPDGKKEKKIGKPVKSRKYADARAAELADTHKATGGKYRSAYTEEVINEEESDRLKDRRMERGGVDGNTRYGSKSSGGGAKRKLSNAELGISPKAKTAYQKQHAGKSALDIVKGSIEKKYGKGAIMDTSKKKNEGVEFAGNYEGPLYAPHPDLVEGKKKGLWDNIHAKRKRGEKPAKPGDKDYPETLNVEEVIAERGDFWHPDPEKDRKLGGPGANQRAREDRAAASKPKEDPKKLRPGESYMDYAKRQSGGKSVAPKKKSLLGRLGLKKEEVGLTYREFVAEAKKKKSKGGY